MNLNETQLILLNNHVTVWINFPGKCTDDGGMHGIEALMKVPLKFNLQWSKEQVWSHNEEFSRGKLRYKSMTTGTN